MRWRVNSAGGSGERVGAVAGVMLGLDQARNVFTRPRGTIPEIVSYLRRWPPRRAAVSERQITGAVGARTLAIVTLPRATLPS